MKAVRIHAPGGPEALRYEDLGTRIQEMMFTFDNLAGATLTKSGAATTSGFVAATTFNNAGAVTANSGTLNAAGCCTGR